MRTPESSARTPSRALVGMLFALAVVVAGFALVDRAATVACASDNQNTAVRGQPLAPPVPDGMRSAVFAGGCFWCMEEPFESLDGVSEVISGYTGGPERFPTYSQVSGGRTGHTEAVRVTYDPEVVSYDQLLNVFWRSMDPTDAGGQFADQGSQYRPAIYYARLAEREVAETSRDTLAESGPFDEPIVVPIEPLGEFWIAESYHQNYYRTNPEHYRAYKRGSGRVAFLERYWGDAH